jgi:dihydroorotase
MSTKLIKNITAVNRNRQFVTDLMIRDSRIEKIAPNISVKENCEETDGSGCYLLPGVIDDQVHFREPGLTHKASIATESRAAVAGGVTSFMEMPNTMPPATTVELLEAKYDIAKKSSLANYSFFMGVTNDNAAEVRKINQFKNEICGIKIFMGSSTGNMLVDNYITLNEIFANAELLIATHCEDEKIIAANKLLYPNAADSSFHPLIRNEAACFESSLAAVQLAKKHESRLHILHISTQRELQLFTNLFPLGDKRITSEVCVHHLHFTADDYKEKGNLIKCNPAIKAKENKAALWEALMDDRLDIIATDHAPHTWEEKMQPYQLAPSGIPLVQHSLQLMLQYVAEGKITLEKVVEKMCHAPAQCFNLLDRGYLQEGYFADMVMVDMQLPSKVTKENILYKCGWSPFEGHTFAATVRQTWVNGNTVFKDGSIVEGSLGMRLRFDR